MTCLIIAVCTNIVFDELLGLNAQPHLASLSISIQSIFLLPALIKYNFLNKPIEKLGDELEESKEAETILKTHKITDESQLQEIIAEIKINKISAL